MLKLPENEIHLWFALPQETDDPQGLGHSDGILDKEEMARSERLRFPDDRRLFESSHTLLRSALSQYSERSPQEWRFVKDEHGKPHVDPDIEVSLPLSFSLAHTKGLAVVSVTKGTDIGVDIERTDRPVDAAGLSRRFFSPEEIAVLQELRPEALRNLFPLYWTLKESYIKARGLGLSLPLDSFSFRLSGENPFRIEFSCSEPNRPEGWRFAVLHPFPEYVAAVGFHFAQPHTIGLRCFQMLSSEEISRLGIKTLGLSSDVEINEDEKEI